MAGQARAMALEKANWVCSSMPRVPVVRLASAKARWRMVEGVFVFLPEVGERGFALGEGEEEFGEAVALEVGADDEGRGGGGDDVGEEALGLAPARGGEVLQRGAGGDEDGVDACTAS